MNYLSVENVSKAFGERIIFKNLAFGINKDQKIAFIAKNGTGKTTLMNIIMGIDSPDEGQIVQRKDIKIGYLSQTSDFDDNLTIEEAIFASDNEILKIIRNYESAIKDHDQMDNMEKAIDLMDQHHAWDFETLYKQILSKLKLEDLSLKISNLSGGQKKTSVISALPHQ